MDGTVLILSLLLNELTPAFSIAFTFGYFSPQKDISLPKAVSK